MSKKLKPVSCSNSWRRAETGIATFSTPFPKRRGMAHKQELTVVCAHTECQPVSRSSAQCQARSPSIIAISCHLWVSCSAPQSKSDMSLPDGA